jgi:hypothetical protein
VESEVMDLMLVTYESSALIGTRLAALAPLAAGLTLRFGLRLSSERGLSEDKPLLTRYFAKAKPRPFGRPKVGSPVLSSWLAKHTDLYAHPNLDSHVARWIAGAKAADGTSFSGTVSDVLSILKRLRSSTSMSISGPSIHSRSVAATLEPFVRLPSSLAEPVRTAGRSNPNAERNRNRAAL